MSVYDSKTEKWFRSHPGMETTVIRCEKCGLFYKPILGHTCRKSDTEGTRRKKERSMFFAGLDDAADMN